MNISWHFDHSTETTRATMLIATDLNKQGCYAFKLTFYHFFFLFFFFFFWLVSLWSHIRVGESNFINVCFSVTSQFPAPPSLSLSTVYSVFISRHPSNDNKALKKASAAVISMAKLLFWLTQVPLFTLGAWERTPGVWYVYWELPFSKFATAKSVFEQGRRWSSHQFSHIQNAALQKLPVPGVFKSGGYHWFLPL